MEWKAFRIGDLFEFILSKGDNQADKLLDGCIPLVSSGMNNNGITKFILDGDGKSELFHCNVITIDMFGKAFQHQYDFYSVSHGRINVLSPRFNSNSYILHFIVVAINESLKNIFSYNRMCSQKRLNFINIFLPIDSNGSPDWQFMEEYIKQKEKKHTKMIVEYYKEMLANICRGEGSNSSLENVEWKEFFFSDIFEDIQRGKRLIKSNQLAGDTPYISSTSLNNGIDNFIANKDCVRKFSNNITLANSGSVGEAFYHSYEYIASDHVTSLKLKDGNKYIYLFLTSIMRRLKEKYSFNREISDGRIIREKILLPIDSLGNPNWKFMESYIKSIEAKQIEKIIKYLRSLER